MYTKSSQEFANLLRLKWTELTSSGVSLGTHSFSGVTLLTLLVTEASQSNLEKYEQTSDPDLYTSYISFHRDHKC